MNFYIKEWPDDTATLMTEHGHVVWIFPSVEEAEAAARNHDETAATDELGSAKTLTHIRAVA